MVNKEKTPPTLGLEQVDKEDGTPLTYQLLLMKQIDRVLALSAMKPEPLLQPDGTYSTRVSERVLMDAITGAVNALSAAVVPYSDQDYEDALDKAYKKYTECASEENYYEYHRVKFKEIMKLLSRRSLLLTTTMKFKE